ncbi:MAG TPA: type II toxin-antitoxin system prevent-host-death family antitoxin [Vicinamibacterales bacterium]|nr:type II toxin-antitoxin system prevent-host-death family antitoxin [Vicinamibacterales bacterium]
MDRNVVGARELKARLGTYLRRVRQGRTLIVTDRGHPVAELRPIEAGSGAEAVLAKLQAAGAVTRTLNRPLRPFRQVVSRGGLAADTIVDDRADRF